MYSPLRYLLKGIVNMLGNRAVGRAALLAFVLMLSCAIPRETRASEPEVVTNTIGMKLVAIPAGEFMMGLEEDPADTLKKFPNWDPKWLEGELPRHRVRITKPLYMGQYEVTLNEFLKFYHDAKYKIEAERDGGSSLGFDKSGHLVESIHFRPWHTVAWKIELSHPVIYVTWNDAIEFCRWLSEKENLTYRLPTEAEWEYACRAGTETRYSFGNDPEDLVRFGNSADSERFNALFPNSTNPAERSLFVSGRDGYVWTAPAGRFPPNAFGLYDMHGNAWEWCSDWYDEDYYKNSPTDDPPGPDTGSSRVLRGGGFCEAPVFLRCARRNDDLPSSRDFGNSFRVVRVR